MQEKAGAVTVRELFYNGDDDDESDDASDFGG